MMTFRSKRWNSLWCILLGVTPWQTLVQAEDYPCDEAKCRGSRTHPWVDDDTEFTCWAAPPHDAEEWSELAQLEAALADPAMGYCSEGYVGRVVLSTPRQVVDDELRYWYTCCPQDSDYAVVGDEALEVTQTCSESACSSPDWASGGNCWADGFQDPMVCGEREFRYPRYTGMQSLIYGQYLCCTSPQEGNGFMKEMMIAKVIWMSLSSITLLVCIVFIAAVLSHKKVRKDGYNVYLIFLAVPDAIANAMILVRNALAISGMPVSPTAFVFAASFEYFYAAANMFLNAVIVGEIHSVLRRSSRERKTPPPPVKKVCIQSAVVFAIATIFFGWSFYLYIHGLIAFSLATVVNTWIATRAIMVSPPLLYVLAICVDVWYRDLLPISGRTRVLALYFLRVIVVFLLTWVPYFILYEVAWNITYSRWMVHTSYYLGSVQGTISVMVALSKPDVKKAFWTYVYTLGGLRKLKKHGRHRDGRETAPALTPDTSGVELSSSQGMADRFYHRNDDLWHEEDIWGQDDLEAIINGEFDADMFHERNSPHVEEEVDEKATPEKAEPEHAIMPEKTKPPRLAGEKPLYRIKPLPEEERLGETSNDTGGDWFQRYDNRVKRLTTSSLSDNS